MKNLAIAALLALAVLPGCKNRDWNVLAPSVFNTPTPSVPSATGVFRGPISDSTLSTTAELASTQSGSTVTGTVTFWSGSTLQATGNLTGTMSGTTLSFSIDFPAGSYVCCQLCNSFVSGIGTVSWGGMSGTYSGAFGSGPIYCSGPITGGVFNLTRQ
jgi:hypothetical protein